MPACSASSLRCFKAANHLLNLPCFVCRVLAGDRAREWALSRGLSAAASSAEAAGWHLTDRSQRQWRKYRRMVDEGSGGGGDAVAANVAGAAPGPAAAATAARPSREAPQVKQQGAKPDRHHHHHQQQQQPQPEQALQQGGKRRRVDSAAAQQPSPPQEEASEEAGASCFYDTVGCVVLAPDGSVAAGVSSGGILLKTEGRVGEAAAFGAGCWAQAAQPAVPRAGVPPKQQQEQTAAEQQEQAAPPLPALACSVTGVGEAVMRHLLARDCCTEAAAAAEAASQAAAAAGAAEAGTVTADGSETEDGDGLPTSEPPLAQLAAALLQRTVLRGPPPHDCGLLCLKAQAVQEAPDDAQRQNGGACGVADGGQQQDRHPVHYAVEVSVAHCAQSMAFGHMACAPARSGGGGAGSSGSGGAASRAASPAVFVLRRQASCSGRPAPAVQTYTHGTTLLL